MASERGGAGVLARAATREVKSIHRRVVRRALRKLEVAAERAMEIDDDGLSVPEPQRADHVAKDLRKSKRESPMYIDVLLRRTEFVEKLEAARETEGKGVQLNIGTVAVQVVVTEYPSMKIDEGKTPE